MSFESQEESVVAEAAEGKPVLALKSPSPFRKTLKTPFTWAETQVGTAQQRGKASPQKLSTAEGPKPFFSSLFSFPKLA